MFQDAQQTLPSLSAELPPTLSAAGGAAYESLAGRLLAYRDHTSENVILMAGAVSGGRSERVVLVDANLRSPSQHKALDIARSDGLTDVLAGDAALNSAVISNLRSGFSLLASGRSAATRPQNLFTQSTFRDVMSTLQAEFDWVIIDSPPATAFPDAACLAGAAGGADLVLPAESTRWEVAEEAKNVLHRSGIEIVSAVLNRRRYYIPENIYHRL